MNTLLERGLQMAAHDLPSAAGGTIVYQRGDCRTSLAATFGRTEFSVEEADSGRVEYSDRDFIFPARTLTIAGVIVTPQRGDRITVFEEANINGQIFEVLAPGGMQPYRLCDLQGFLMRVHTKRVS